MDDAPRGAPAQPVDNAYALPTACAFAHMPTAFDHDEVKKPRKTPGVSSPGLPLIATPHAGNLRSPDATQTRR